MSEERPLATEPPVDPLPAAGDVPPIEPATAGVPAFPDPIEAMLARRLAEARAALAGSDGATPEVAPAVGSDPAATRRGATSRTRPRATDPDETSPSAPTERMAVIGERRAPEGPVSVGETAATPHLEPDAFVGTEPAAADSATPDDDGSDADPASGRTRSVREGRSFGPFVLQRRLASGGLAAVFLATDARDGRSVAIKVMRPEVTPDSELAGLAERSLAVARQIAHPNLIEVYEGGWIDGRRYTAMAHHDGKTLDRELVAGPLELARGLAILRQILDAACAIHAAGMAHRDLKPANVLVVAPSESADARSAEPVVKILDLDFLGPVSERRPRAASELIGTPKYMAPEEIHRGYPHPKGDVFSIGIMAYEMFTGREPFTVDKEVGYLYANRFAVAVPPSELKPGLPRELDRWIAGLIARQPVERYDAKTALRDCRALEEAAGTPGATATLVGPPAHRDGPVALAVLAAVAAVALVAGFVAWAAAPAPLAPMASTDAKLDLAPPRTIGDRMPPLEPWPRERVVASGGADVRDWERARLAYEHAALPGQVEAAIHALERLAEQREHPSRAAAARLASEGREAAYRRLAPIDPARAATELRAAIAHAETGPRRVVLEEELAWLLERSAPGSGPPVLVPEGFVRTTTEPRAAIARRPVTGLEYHAFLDVDKAAERPPGWGADGVPPGFADAPVRGLSAPAAAAYALWRGARLPRADELRTRGLDREPSEWAVRSGRPTLEGDGPRAEEAVMRLVVDAGGELRPISLAKARHRLRIRSSPPGASVLIDGRRVGVAPLDVRLLTSGLVEVRLEIDGYLPAIELVEPTTAEVELELQIYKIDVVPWEMRGYTTSPELALDLIDYAFKKRDELRQEALAHAFILNAYRAHSSHYAVLLEVVRYLAPQPRPQLLAHVQGRIAALEARIDELRTRGDPPEALWRDLEALGYGRRVDMVRIPAGPFKFGTAEPSRVGDVAVRTVQTRAYWIDRYEVRIRDYLRFVRATRAALPPGLALPIAEDRLDHPVTGVDFAQATAYARWVGKRLPDELEWCKAARGEIYRKYPWGDDFFSRNANTGEGRRGGTAVVGSYPRDVSPFGVYDLGGNVAEWTTSEFENGFIPRPMVLLGGSFKSPPAECLISSRLALPAGDRRDDVGFRCAGD